MSAAATSTNASTRPGVKSVVVGAILGYLLGSAVLHLMMILCGGAKWGGDADSWRALFGIVEPWGGTWAGAFGAALGGGAGRCGIGVYGRASFGRAWFGAAMGLLVGIIGTGLVREAFDLGFYKEAPAVVMGGVAALLGFLWGIGTFPDWWHYMKGGATPAHEDHSGHGAQRWTDYFKFNTDHKVIGIQYMVTNFSFMIIGGLMASMVRAELAQPGLQYVKDGLQFNQIMTAHGAIMLFLFIIPIFAGIANYVLPIMIGAPDMAFPRLNALSYWMLLFGGFVFLASFPIGAAASGWTNYAPLSSMGGKEGLTIGQLLFVLGVQLIGTSSIMTAINFIVTIVAMRAPGMTMWKMPLLVWANLTTSLLVVFGTPFIAGSQFMVLFDSVMNMNFFDAARGGDAITYQHVFWFYSHPAVYIMMLPGFGIISEVITTHARKPIFGYKALAVSTLAIGFLGFTVWAHHMFTSGMNDWLRLPMMVATMLIAVPTGVKVLGWSATLWKSRIYSTTAMHWVIGFLFTFTCGGLTGVMLASVPFDQHVQDSYFVVAHFHYVLFGGSMFTVMAGIHHWYPKITGRMHNETLGKIQFWLIFVGMNMTFFPMHWIGTLGMPRRVPDYEALSLIQPEVSTWNMVATLGALLQGVGFLVFFYNMIVSWHSGPRAPANPWRSRTLEWLVTSPPPLFNFHQTPMVIGAPYGYGHADQRHAVLDPADIKEEVVR